VTASRRILLSIVFLAGMTSMAVEMAGARLLDPYFGNSLIVWASLIGLILIYLSAGYFVGGRLADRWPRPALLYQITLWASFVVGVIPFVARPILRFAAAGMAGYQAGLLLGSLLGVLALFSIPVFLLGCVSPFAIRLLMREVSSAGNTSGRVYSLSTIGSIAGTFLPVLLLIPNLGTRATFLIAAGWLLIPSLLALWYHAGRRALAYLLLPALLVAVAILQANRPIKAAERLIYETESAYNYIQVVDIDGSTCLKLNEGEGIHSLYNPSETMTFALWDYFLIVPYFNNPPYAPAQVRSLCMIGLAAGTIPKLYTAAYGPIPIDGAELDPEIIEVGRRFFAMTEPNLSAYAEDGRRFLAGSSRRYDVIAVDAYRPPYIPFHLTTREFFEETRRHLTPAGVVAINVARTANDSRLVEALAGTMAAVFPSVYVINEPLFGDDLGNSIVVATLQPTQLSNFAANRPLLQANPLLDEVARRIEPYIAPAPAGGPVLTDDRAPVEQIVHQLILRYVLAGG
jgi:predicted membrane-bound spermidine synthase